MNWPQVVMVLLMMFGTVFHIVKIARNREVSSSVVTLGVLVILALQAAYAGLLHAGGFW